MAPAHYGLAVLVVILALAVLTVRGPRWRARRRQILREDAVKQIFSARHEGRPASPSEVAGRLGLSAGAMLRLAEELETAGLARSHNSHLELTAEGEAMGRRLLRGHRLFEQFLSGDGRMPLDRVHMVADRAEHRLTADDVDALADRLGHPLTDPHGDIVPGADGTVPRPRRTPLTDWPIGALAVVAHVEDEPPESLAKILAAGLKPGTALRVVSRDAERIVCETAAGFANVPPAVAAGVDLRLAAVGERLAAPPPTLADLPLGDEAEVAALADACTGLGRRRLLDLGFTEGARVRAVLSNLGGEAHVYEIRDTRIALRGEQAAQVLVRPVLSLQHQPMSRHEARP